MAKAKQVKAEESTQEESYLFAIGTPDGDMVLKVGSDGDIIYLKEGTSLSEAARAFWDSFQVFLPITIEEIDERPNDDDLGRYVRNRMNTKLSQ